MRRDKYGAVDLQQRPGWLPKTVAGNLRGIGELQPMTEGGVTGAGAGVRIATVGTMIIRTGTGIAGCCSSRTAGNLGRRAVRLKCCSIDNAGCRKKQIDDNQGSSKNRSTGTYKIHCFHNSHCANLCNQQQNVNSVSHSKAYLMTKIVVLFPAWFHPEQQASEFCHA